jgi:ABC transport system ATP-binding/permease protein
MSNLVNLERVSKAYGVRPLLAEVSLGVSAGERIGIVGRNGDGKTTLLQVMTGQEPVDEGRVSAARGLHVGYLHQGDTLDDTHSVRDSVLGGRPDHVWAAEPQTREVVEELLAGIELDRAVVGLSGGERRRCALAELLLREHDLLVLDEPTNHLDVEAVAWLAAHLVALSSALVVVTHDRWFLDAVCERTWEVHDGVVDSYDGGYAAYVLAKAERQRQSAASEVRRRNLARKELAWLRRGPPARTAKPKFRIEAAETLIADEPPPRDRLELQRFAMQRLGKDVIDVEDVDLVRGDRTLLSHATWRLGPGDRVGLVGVNGAGKSSVLSLVDGTLAPVAGRVKHGRTITMQHLTQALDVLDPDGRVLPTIESIRRVARTVTGEISASSMLERFGFTGDKLTARIGDLSGGERRRFQLLRLLLSEPNVLLLDEPTNDLDIDTLNVLEDFLDDWPGTLVVVSHDRYFLERVTDVVYGLLDDGQISLLPGGVDEYLTRRKRLASELASPLSAVAPPRQAGVERPRSAAKRQAELAESAHRDIEDTPSRQVTTRRAEEPVKARSGSSEERTARKVLAKVEKRLGQLSDREAELNAEVLAHASDHERLATLGAQLAELTDERDALEEEWLEAAEVLE